MATLRQILYRLAFAGHHYGAAGRFFTSDIHSTMLNTDKRDKLIVIMLHEKNVAIANFEMRRVGDFHRFVTHGSAEHSDRVRRPGIAFNVVFNFERHVGFDVALTAFALPN